MEQRANRQAGFIGGRGKEAVTLTEEIPFQVVGIQVQHHNNYYYYAGPVIMAVAIAVGW
jgi:hypothetical protein